MASHSAKWKLTFAAWVGLALLYGYLGSVVFGPTVPATNERGWWAIAGAVVVLLLKYSLSASREDDYVAYQQGYDCCLLAVGVAVPGFAGVLVNGSTNLQVWAAAAVASLIALVLSSGLVKTAQRAGEAQAPGFWTLLNLALGLLTFFMYMFLIVVRAQA